MTNNKIKLKNNSSLKQYIKKHNQTLWAIATTFAVFAIGLIVAFTLETILNNTVSPAGYPLGCPPVATCCGQCPVIGIVFLLDHLELIGGILIFFIILGFIVSVFYGGKNHGK